MKTGSWHQLGYNSQKLVEEQLEHNSGVGVVFSPRDLKYHLAKNYAEKYHDLGASVLIDPQFYNLSYVHNNLGTYPFNEVRLELAGMGEISSISPRIDKLTEAIKQVNVELNTDGIIAPAITYKADRNDIIELNNLLFQSARTVGDELGLPVYSSVILGRSVTSHDDITERILSNATSQLADGWYFGYQFNGERIPRITEEIIRFGKSILSLACTEKPVFHSFAGPLGLISYCFGASATGIGHFQNLWQFTPERWQPTTETRGGPPVEPPPRYFSTNLWGTIIYPDELNQLPEELFDRVVDNSPFSAGSVEKARPLPWRRWDANKHLVFKISERLTLLSQQSIETRLSEVKSIIERAINLYQEVNDNINGRVQDNADKYHPDWLESINYIEENQSDDYDLLNLLASIE